VPTVAVAIVMRTAPSFPYTVELAGGSVATSAPFPPLEGSTLRILQHHVPVSIVLLAAGEFTVFLSAPVGAALLRGRLHGWELHSIGPLQVIAYAVVMLVSMISLGLYHRRQRARFAGILARLIVALGGGTAVVGLLSYLLPAMSVPRSVLVTAGLVALAGVGTLRLIFDRAADDDVFKRRVLVVGAGRRAVSIAQLRRRADQRGFQVHGFVARGAESQLVPADKIVTVDGPLLAYCARFEIDEIVVAMDDRRKDFPVSDFLECKLKGMEVTDIVDFLERETGRLRLDVLNPSWIIFAEGFRTDPWRQLLEQMFDVVASVGLLAITWPVMLLTAIAIMIEDGPRAPVLYRQARIGQGGRVFSVLKFRSMRVDAEPGGAQWAAKSDPRVTRVGALIRKMRIDELPQILNVLKGDMRFVGPRPERPEFVHQFEDRIPYYHERHSVKPGLTGWAQLCYPYGASDLDAAEKLQYDLYYIKNRSSLFDLMILLQTIEVVLLGKGGR
jgi:sugar transferase (PEP-CTERM system associated)